MAVKIVPFTPQLSGAVRDFNRRLRAAGAADDLGFPEPPDPGWMPGMELFVAVEGAGDVVRGGYILRQQRFWFGGVAHEVAHYRLPLSEGLIDRAYAMLGLRLVRDALARQPRLYALGMGAWDKPLPQMLKRMGWRMCGVPFYFKVVHPFRFLRNLRALRTSAPRRLAMDLAAFSGAGWLGVKALGFTRRGAEDRVSWSAVNRQREIVPDFADWTDEIWQRCRSAYAMLALRDAPTLERLYPASDARFLRLRTPRGWAVLLDTSMSGHKQFGDMHVGTIADCLARPEDAPEVIGAAAHLLETRGVDLVISNQRHASWSSALREAGFRRGPSNFLLALSPEMAACTGPAADGQFHINRGDGDGPIHL